MEMEMVKGSVHERFISAYLVNLVQKFGPFLCCQPPNLWQQLLINNPMGSLLSQEFGWQVTVHKLQDCRFPADQIACRSKCSSNGGGHGEKFFGRDGEAVLI